MLLLILVPLAVYLTRTSMALLRSVARRVSLALRILIVTLLVLALAGLEAVNQSDRLSVLFLVDHSDSIGDTARVAQTSYINASLGTMREGDSSGVVVFGNNALVDRPVSESHLPPDLSSAPVTTFSNLDEAIRLGLAAAPADRERRLVLLSDGRENTGNAEWAARLAAANGVSLDVVPLGSGSGPDVAIAGMKAPATVRQNERSQIDITVQSSIDTTSTLALFVDGQPIARQVVNLTRGQNNFTQSLPPLSQGFHTYRAGIEAPPGADTVAQNNSYDAFTLVLGKPRILIVAGQPGEGAALVSALSPSVDADVVSPDAAPASVDKLAQYEGTVLVNVPSTALSATQMRSLQSVVRDLGKGMVVVGGDESYAAGGYFRTPLEEMLPVDLHLPSKLDIPTVAMILVIDRSGSMGETHNLNGTGITKLSLAKEAAYRAVAQLSEKDYVGVVTFDEAANWVIEPQKLGDPHRFQGNIQGISLGGGTNIYAGLSPAVDALVASKAKSKHIVLLTDGVSEGGDYAGLLKKMDENNITLSSVAIGADADQAFLMDLASKGQGRYYYTGNGDALPDIFAHESHIAARSYLIEHRFTPQRSGPSPILDGLGGLPDVLGYIGTSPRPGGQIDLVSDAGDPLLAQWQYGLGRVAAWTSDAKGQWAKEWVGWDGFPRFWTQAVRWSTGTEGGGVLQSRVTVDGQTGRVVVDASSSGGELINNLAASASIVAPDLTTWTVALAQTAPGRYEGSFNAPEQGVYLLSAQASGPGLGKTSQTVGVVVPYSPEYRAWEGGDTLLPRLAEITGGRVLGIGDTGSAFSHNLPPVSNSQPLWPWLVLLAVLILPFDVGVRRVAVSRADLAKGLSFVRARFAGRRVVPVPAGVTSATQVAARFEARRRTRSESGPAAPPDYVIVSATSVRAENSAPRGTGDPDAQPSSAGARDLQVSGRTEHKPLTPAEVAPEGQPSEANGEDLGAAGLAARLREAREKRR